MPVTPFHMGPGIAVKAIAGRHFSLLMFGLAQVAIDIEPAIGMVRGGDVLHGWTHTYLGATAIAVVVLAIGRPLCVPILRWWNAELRRQRLDWLATSDTLGWFPAATGAFVGTYSHIALDSLMHYDMRPFAPLSEGNAMLELVSLPTLYWSCVIAGLVGAALWFGRHFAARKAIASG